MYSNVYNNTNMEK